MFHDLDGDSLALSLYNLPEGVAFDASTYQLFGSPNPGSQGEYRLVLKADDGHPFGQAQSQFYLFVPNRAPIFQGLSDVVVNVGQTHQAYFDPPFIQDLDADNLVVNITLGTEVLSIDWLVLNATSSKLKVSPPPGSQGEYPINLSAVDPWGANASAQFKIIVPNRAPMITALPNLVLNVGKAYQHTYNALFSDADNDPLDTTVVMKDGSSIPTWLKINSTSGQVEIKPPRLSQGIYEIQLTAVDPFGGYSAKSFTVTVPNQPPSLPNLADMTVLIHKTNTRHYTPFVTDSDQDPLTVTASWDGGALPVWAQLNLTSGELMVTPPPGSQNSYLLSVKAKDFVGAEVEKSMVVNVPNRAPFLSDIGSLQLYIGQTKTVPVVASDPDSDPLIITLSGRPPEWVSLVGRDLVFTPPSGSQGSYNLAIQVEDSFGLTSSIEVILTVPNRPPRIQGLRDTRVFIGQPLKMVYPGLVTDPDGDTFVVEGRLNGQPLTDWVQFNFTHYELMVMPTAGDQGNHVLEVLVEDSQGALASSDMAITIPNRNPTIRGFSDLEVYIGERYQASWTGFLAQDPDGDSVTIEIDLSDGTSLPSWLQLNTNTQTLVIEPPLQSQGSYRVRPTASDPHDGVSQSQWTLTVPNRSPVLQGLSDITVRVGEILDRYYEGLATDADGDEVTVSASVDGQDSLDWLVFNTTAHRLVAQPTSSSRGRYVVQLTAKDPLGASDIKSFAVTVPNQAPLLVRPFVDISRKAGASWQLDLTADHFKDADDDELTFTLTQVSGEPLPSWLTFFANGTLVASNTPSTLLTLNLLIKASDAEASVSDTFSLSQTNARPEVVGEIANQIWVLGPNHTFSLPLDVIVDSDDALDYSLSQRGQPLAIWLVFNGTTLTGQPSKAELGDSTLQLKGTDGQFSASTAFGLSVVPSLATSLGVQEQTYQEDVPINLTALAIESKSEDELTVRYRLSTPLAGKLQQAGLESDPRYQASQGEWRWSGPVANWSSISPLEFHPSADYDQPLTIRITVDDNLNPIDTLSLSLLANPVNDAPRVIGTLLDQTATIGTLFKMLISDGDLFSDPEGEALSLHFSGLPSWLTFDSANRVLSGIPSVGSQGVSILTLSGEDSDGKTVSVSASLEVVNRPPERQASLADVSIKAGQWWQHALPNNAFADPDQDPLIWQVARSDGPWPTWLSYFAANRTLLGWAPFEVSSLRFSATVKDPFNQEASDGFSLSLTNAKPEVLDQLPDKVVEVGQPFQFTLPDNAIVDQDDPKLTFGLSQRTRPLPSWMAFNSKTLTVRGLANRQALGRYTLRLRGSDGQYFVTIDFTLDVVPSLIINLASQEIIYQEDHIQPLPLLNISSRHGPWKVYYRLSDPIAGQLRQLHQTEDSLFNRLRGEWHWEGNASEWNNLPPLSYQPSADYDRQASVKVTVEDGVNEAAHTSLLLIGQGENDAPRIVGALPSLVLEEGQTFNIRVGVSQLFIDPDGDVLSFESAPIGPTWLKYDAIEDRVKGEVPNDEEGDYQWGIIASDRVLSTSIVGEVKVNPDAEIIKPEDLLATLLPIFSASLVISLVTCVYCRHRRSNLRKATGYYKKLLNSYKQRWELARSNGVGELEEEPRRAEQKVSHNLKVFEDFFSNPQGCESPTEIEKVLDHLNSSLIQYALYFPEISLMSRFCLIRLINECLVQLEQAVGSGDRNYLLLQNRTRLVRELIDALLLIEMGRDQQYKVSYSERSNWLKILERCEELLLNNQPFTTLLKKIKCCLPKNADRNESVSSVHLELVRLQGALLTFKDSDNGYRFLLRNAKQIFRLGKLINETRAIFNRSPAKWYPKAMQLRAMLEENNFYSLIQRENWTEISTQLTKMMAVAEKDNHWALQLELVNCLSYIFTFLIELSKNTPLTTTALSINLAFGGDEDPAPSAPKQDSPGSTDECAKVDVDKKEDKDIQTTLAQIEGRLREASNFKGNIKTRLTCGFWKRRENGYVREVATKVLLEKEKGDGSKSKAGFPIQRSRWLVFQPSTLSDRKKEDTPSTPPIANRIDLQQEEKKSKSP